MQTEMLARKRRQYWVEELAKLSGSFGTDSSRMMQELQAEITREGIPALLDHLRVCGGLPESYRHDSSAEKLYSKYTDAILNESFIAIGLTSEVINARSDSADVQARGQTFSLVADAKAFRLSRSAKNQKDFKIQAMDGWRDGLDFAIVVGPIYQLPTRASQIYQQAIARNVCVLSYAHIATIVSFAQMTTKKKAEDCFHFILKSISLMNPSKNADSYWLTINQALLDKLGNHVGLWNKEILESFNSLNLIKEESLKHLRLERNRILGLSHQAALEELIRMAGIDSRIKQVERLEHGNLLGE